MCWLHRNVVTCLYEHSGEGAVDSAAFQPRHPSAARAARAALRPADPVHAAARTSGGATQMEALHRGFGSAETRQRAKDDLLKQRCGAAVHRAGMQVGVRRFQPGRQLLATGDDVIAEAGRVLLDDQVDGRRQCAGRPVVSDPAWQMAVGPGTFGSLR